MSEAREQAKLMMWASRQPDERLRWLYHCPNGGLRDKVVAGQLKAMGVKPGVPDLHLPVAVGGYVGLVGEMKFGDGRPTKEQKEWLQHFAQQGWMTGIWVGAIEAQGAILAYLAGEYRAGEG